MPGSRAKNLSSLFFTAVKTKVATNDVVGGDRHNRASAITSVVMGKTTRQPFVPTLNSSASTSTSSSRDEMHKKFASDRKCSSEDHIPAPNVKNLSSVFLTGDNTNIAYNGATGCCDRAPVTSSPSSMLSPTSDRHSYQPSEILPLTQHDSPIDNNDLAAVQNLKLHSRAVSENPAIQLTKEISSILLSGETPLKSCSPDSKSSCDDKSAEAALDIPWFPTRTNYKSPSDHENELSREQNRECNFSRKEGSDFSGLVKFCAKRLGTNATIQVFNRLGRQTGPKEYDALIELCIEKARSANNAEISAQQISKALELLKSVREYGFLLKDTTYGSILMFLIDMGMIEDFFLFSGIIKEDNPSSIVSLGYYEMMLWIKANNEEKIEKLCSSIAIDHVENNSNIMASYLLALCESGRKAEMLQLLKLINIAQVSPIDVVSNIFKYLGNQELGLFAEEFILALKTSDYDSKTLSNLIFTYAVNLPNLAVEEVCENFKNLCETLTVVPCSASYEALIKYCCKNHKVHVALGVAEQMGEAGLVFSIQMIDFMLHSCISSQESFLVRRIYALIRRHNLQPNDLTFMHMIKSCVKMRDFDCANDLLNDLQKLNLIPTAEMFNAILSGYCRQKNFDGIMEILKKMKNANVKPDNNTFSNLIKSCECERDINKYFEQLEASGVSITKNVYMSLIYAYGNFGQLEKAKKVVDRKGVPIRNLNEIKSALVHVLASNGEISDALDVYQQIKDSDDYFDQKSATYIIEHVESEGNLDLLLKLLGDLTILDHWVYSCYRVILYCVRYRILSSVIDLFKQLKEKLRNDEVSTEFLFDEVFFLIAESGSTHLQLGMDLIKAIKEELGLRPTRKCLDFLLTTSAIARDLPKSFQIWKEYQNAGLPYNVVSFLRMYQALLTSEDFQNAIKVRKHICLDDPQVCCFIKQCVKTYKDDRFLVHTRRTRRDKRRDRRNKKSADRRAPPFYVLGKNEPRFL